MANDNQNVADKLVVTITEDKMRVFLMVPDTIKSQISPVGIMRKLKEYNINYGVNTDTIVSILKNNDYNKIKMIASGIMPVQGRDMSLTYQFEQIDYIPPRLLKNNIIYESNITELTDVNANDVLIKCKPAVSGSDGIDVHGNVIKITPGKTLSLPLGQNVKLTDNETAVIATVNGKVCIEDGLVSVLPFKEIEGDLDESSPSVQFDGTILIEGRVTGNTKIQTTGSIILHSSPGDCQLFAGDSIVIKDDVLPESQASFTAKGRIFAKAFHQSSIQCDGSLFCHSLIDCTVFCKGTLLSYGDAVIKGGDLTVYGSVNCYDLGDENNYDTVLRAGISEEDIALTNTLQTKLKKLKADLSAIDKALESIELLEQSEDKFKKKLVLMKNKLEMSDKVDDIEQQYDELCLRREKQRHVSVNIANRVYPHVSIKINAITTVIHNSFYRISYVQFPGVIKMCEFMTRTAKV